MGRLDLHGEALNPPQATDAERAVLGSVLKNSEAANRVVDILSEPLDFYSPKHQIIYRAALELFEASEPIDITTVTGVLQRHGELRKVGGRVYLVELIEDVASTANVASHALIVRGAADRRRLMAAAQEVASSCCMADVADEQLTDSLEKALFSFARPAKRKTTRIQESIPVRVDSLLSGGAAVDPSSIIETRISDLNRFLGGGLMKGDTVVVAGPPSMGKSSFALDLCMWNATLSKNSLYFAIDETTRAIEQRVLSGETELGRDKFVRGNFSEAERDVLRKARDGISWQPGRVDVEDRSSLTAAEVRSIARQHHLKFGLDIVVVDYVGRLLPSQSSTNQSRYEYVSENSQLLDAMAKDLNVLMIVVSQLNRGYASLAFNPGNGEFGIPTQSMLRDSGQLEQDANQVIFPWRPLEALRKRGLGPGNKWFDKENAKNPEPIEDAIIVVAKNKEGPTGRVQAKFNGSRMRFYTPSDREEVPTP